MAGIEYYNTSDTESVYMGVNFESIDDEFIWGQLGDFEIIIMAKNGYVNITKICEGNSGYRKLFRKWKKSEDNVQLPVILKDFYASTGISSSDVSISISKGSTETDGLYVNRDIVNNIAHKCCPEHTMHISHIIRAYCVKQYADQTLLEQQTQTKVLTQYKNRLEKNIEQLTSDNAYYKDTNKELFNISARILDVTNDVVKRDNDTSSYMYIVLILLVCCMAIGIHLTAFPISASDALSRISS